MILATLLAACGADNADTGTVQLPDPPDVPEIPDTEIDCEDGVDNDLDGLFDCEDDECAAELRCSLPRTAFFSEQVWFDSVGPVACDDGSTAEPATYREVVSGELPITFDEALQCPSCDLTFTGACEVVYSEGEYPGWLEAAVGDLRPPPGTGFGLGLRSVDDLTFELWLQYADGAWVQSGAVTNEYPDLGSMFQSSPVEVPVEAALDGCTAEPVPLGTWNYGGYTVWLNE